VQPEKHSVCTNQGTTNLGGQGNRSKPGFIFTVSVGKDVWNSKGRQTGDGPIYPVLAELDWGKFLTGELQLNSPTFQKYKPQLRGDVLAPVKLHQTPLVESQITGRGPGDRQPQLLTTWVCPILGGSRIECAPRQGLNSKKNREKTDRLQGGVVTGTICVLATAKKAARNRRRPMSEGT